MWRTTAGAVTVGMGLLAGGFPVNAQATPAPGGSAIRNVATATYVPAGYAQTEIADSNAVIANVLSVEALVLTQDQNVTRPPSVVISLSHLLTNTGNVPSNYTLAFANNGTGCSADTVDLNNLRIVRDLNNNGVVDSGDPVVAIGMAGAIHLAPGETASLIVQGTTPGAASGSACLTLSATTALQGLTAFNHDTATLGSVAVMSLTKSANNPGFVIPGTTVINFVVSGTNVGAQDAAPVSSASPGATPILVNGAPATLFLLRDLVPAGTQYVAGSLQSNAAGAVRLFRLSGDPAFSYRTAEDASAVEVAIGIPTAISRNASVAMQFAVKVDVNQSGDIRNTAQNYYNDAATPTLTNSNTVVITSTPTRIGVAKAANTPRVNFNAAGGSDGTATVTFIVRLKNYGSTWLHDVQAADMIEGAGATRFGTYTSAAVPGAGQYTLVPGSLAIIGNQGNGVAGTVVAVNPLFNGASVKNLLANGAVLPVGSEASVKFDIRLNVTGRTQTLLNTVRAQAALNAGSAPAVFDDSTNGADPDADGDGNPNNDASPTPVSVQLPALNLVKTASLPRRVDAGVFELDYTLHLTNDGLAAAPNVRVLDNLNCTFDMDLPTGKIAAWELVGQPRIANGNLLPASGFTGRAVCDRAGLASNDPFRVPTEVALSLTDGSRALAPGQSEVISFTVRITEKPGTIGSRVLLTNKAWAASYELNTVNVNPALLVAAASNAVLSLLIDPQGTVYNAISRQPISGAVVTYKRQSCSSGSATPITADEIFGSGSGVYTLNTDGSISMTTGADGTYQFFLKSPPVTSLCTYSLLVTPPAGSGYVYPSQLIPVIPGSHTGCTAVVASATAPQGSDPTTYYFSVQSGVSPGPGLGTPCESVHNHIALDPGNIFGLVLKKDGSKKTAEFGDFLDYALTLTNKTGFPISSLTFNDVLPAGFAYVAGSARFNGVATPNPAGGAGPNLVFNYPAIVLGVDESATVRYRLRIGVGTATSGDAVNRARANSGVLQSNEASWRVRVSGGVFSDEAFLFGKVHMECRRDGSNGVQGGTDEIGIPGVRIYMEDGTNVVTDVEGKWSLYGIKPITHVLRVDQTTLPAGAQLEVLDNRNANNPDSRFVDMKKGEFQKANFIVSNCDNPTVMADVAARRKLVSERPDADGEAAVRVRLDAQGRQIAVGDTRALPATGQSSVTGAAGSIVPASQALIKLPATPVDGANFIGGVGSTGALNGTLGNAQQGGVLTPLSGAASGLLSGGVGSGVGTLASNGITSRSGPLSPAATILLPQAAASTIELEQVMPTLDNKPGFINLKDRDTVASQAINVQVKGPAGAQLRLFVDSQPIDDKRVGKKAALASKNLAAWEYIGVQLKPGSNLLRLDVTDDFGIARSIEQITVIAPDKLGDIQIDVPATAQADLRTPILVNVRLTDANGVPVTARTQITLEADRGRWLEDDLNNDEPGLQAFIEGGAAEFHLLPPGEPGDARIRVATATFVREVRMALLPEMRPMFGVGVVEGTIDFTRRGKLSVGQTPAGGAFETELSSVGGDDNANIRTAARSAFFLKGTVKGEYLLTAAYDSDKTTKDRLFRDIRPDEFYPIYGDSSFRGFDAQSTQKLYVRIDKGHSYLLYGDFTTASSTEVRQLSQTSRTLTGIKSVVETDSVRTTTYASRTAQTQQVEEFQARGISGPYYLTIANGDLLTNSERIEILVRDRNQPNIVLQTTAVTRFVDYTVEPLTQRLLFTRPIASVDSNLNPQSIRVTYEVDTNGPKFTVAGTDVQLKVNDKLQVGAVASTDENPDNPRKLGALTAIARLGDNTTVAGELVRTDTDLKGTGNAERIELRYQNGQLGAVAQVAKTGTGFDNPGATFTSGRTEAVARAEYKVDNTTSVRGEAIYSKDTLTQGNRQGVAVGMQKKLSDTLVGEVGLRHGDNSSATASMFDYHQVSSTNGALGAGNTGNSITTLGAAVVAAGTTREQDLTTVRGRLTTAVPNLPQAQVFIEGEQDINHSDRHVVAAGGNYAISDKTRAYGRYEFISSLDGPYSLSSTAQRNVGILGVESNYMEGGRVYNEYRLADALDGRTGQAAMGVRNTFKVNEQWRLTAGIERTKATGSSNAGIVGQGNSTAIVSGAEYLTENVKASGILEARHGDDANSYLSNMGFACKLDTAWSLLARSIVSDSKGNGTNAGNNRQLMRQQIGMAYRPVNQDVWNALARYEHKSERVSGGGTATGAVSGNQFGNDASLPGTYTADIVSTHFNYNPERGSYLMGRYAGKISSANDGLLKSTYWANLLQLRYTRDLSKDWDIGVQVALLYGKGGALQKSFGLEAGYQVAKDLWVSAGYNFIGLKDRDLTAGEYTSEGVYIRFRFKFDENIFSNGSPTVTK